MKEKDKGKQNKDTRVTFHRRRSVISAWEKSVSSFVGLVDILLFFVHFKATLRLKDKFRGTLSGATATV